MSKSTLMTIRLVDYPEVAELVSRTLALVSAVQGLPSRWSDGCGTCPWCVLDAAMDAMADITCVSKGLRKTTLHDETKREDADWFAPVYVADEEVF